MGRVLKDIVEAAAAGEAKAIRELVEATQGRIYKFCLVLCGDPVKAEDLSQEAFIKALANLKNLKNPEAFMDWLFRVTRNLYIDQVRRQHEEQLQPDEENQHAAPNSDVTEALQVHSILSQFETEDRWLLVLVDMENYTYAEAAKMMGVSEDTVRSRLFRLRKEFIEKWQSGETK